MVLLRLQIWFG